MTYGNEGDELDELADYDSRKWKKLATQLDRADAGGTVKGYYAAYRDLAAQKGLTEVFDQAFTHRYLSVLGGGQDATLANDIRDFSSSSPTTRSVSQAARGAPDLTRKGQAAPGRSYAERVRSGEKMSAEERDAYSRQY